VSTVQEDHGSGKRLIRARFTARLRSGARLAVGLGVLGGASLAIPFGPAVGIGLACAVLSVTVGAWWSAARRAARAVAVFDHAANKLGLFRCDSVKNRGIA